MNAIARSPKETFVEGVQVYVPQADHKSLVENSVQAVLYHLRRKLLPKSLHVDHGVRRALPPPQINPGFGREAKTARARSEREPAELARGCVGRTGG